jgi:hypothetical protein
MTEEVQSPARPALNPNALRVDEAAKLLSAAGGQLITAEMIEADVAVGAPVNGDGTLNLVHYAAWLVKEMAGCGD